MSFLDAITVEALERDPYPIYARLRREAPVAFVPSVNSWLVTRWQDVETVTRDNTVFTAETPEGNSPVEAAFGKPAILTSEGDVHAALRSGIEPHYRRKKVESYIDALVRPIGEECLRQIVPKGRAELMTEYFEPISTLSLARSFGFRHVDAGTLGRWFHGLAQGAINYEKDPNRQAISDATCAEIEAAIAPELERIEREPDGSPLSHMLHDGMPAGETRPRSFVLPTLKITLLGGMQEPGHGAGSILIGLLENPDQMRQVLADMDGLLPRAIEEGLRWVNPIGTALRTPRRDVVLAGTVIPKGAPVAAVLASASRDETRFADPDRFDINRKPAAHAAFSFGNHFCAGKWFALAQMEIALRLLLERLPGLAFDGAERPEFRGWEFRAPTSLWVRFGGA